MLLVVLSVSTRTRAHRTYIYLDLLAGVWYDRGMMDRILLPGSPARDLLRGEMSPEVARVWKKLHAAISGQSAFLAKGGTTNMSEDKECNPQDEDSSKDSSDSQSQS